MTTHVNNKFARATSLLEKKIKEFANANTRAHMRLAVDTLRVCTASLPLAAEVWVSNPNIDSAKVRSTMSLCLPVCLSACLPVSLSLPSRGYGVVRLVGLFSIPPFMSQILFSTPYCLHRVPRQPPSLPHPIFPGAENACPADRSH